MKKSVKTKLVVAALLVIAGLMMFCVVMTKRDWDFIKLSTASYATSKHETAADFSCISITTDTADIVFVQSEDGTCEVECYHPENEEYLIEVQDDTLVISQTTGTAWYEHIGFNFDTSKITVSLPAKIYDSLTIEESTGDIDIPEEFEFAEADITLTTGNVYFACNTSGMLKIKTTTGDICVENISAGAIELNVSTGKVNVANVACAGDIQIGTTTGKSTITDAVCLNLISNGSTGDMHMSNVIAEESFNIERSTGGVSFDNCDAGELFIKTSTGDVEGTLLTEKVFITDTSTGTVNIPDSVSGGRCEINTSTGDIEIEISQ